MSEPNPNPDPVAPNRAARRRFRRGRIATAIGIAGVTAVTARVASAQFSASSQVAQSSPFAAGDLALTLGNGDGSQSFDLAIADVYPGISRQRVVDVTNAGSLDFKTLGLYLATDCSGCSYSELDAGSSALSLAIEHCSVAWTASNSSPDRTYQCADNGAGTYKGEVVLADTPIHNIKNDSSLGLTPGTTDITTNLTLTAGAVNHLLFTFTLPSSAPANTQSQTSVYGFTFQGTQRDATDK